LTGSDQVGDGVGLDGDTLGSGGADVDDVDAAESLLASAEGDGAGDGVGAGVLGGAGGVVGGGVVSAALLVGAGAGGVVGSGAADEVVGALVPVAEPLGS
jgi:hypothetical protein